MLAGISLLAVTHQAGRTLTMTTDAQESLPEIAHANRMYTLGSTIWGNGCTFGEFPVQFQKIQGQSVLVNVQLVYGGGNQPGRQMWVHAPNVARGPRLTSLSPALRATNLKGSRHPEAAPARRISLRFSSRRLTPVSPARWALSQHPQAANSQARSASHLTACRLRPQLAS
jgi:hypothetical protein